MSGIPPGLPPLPPIVPRDDVSSASSTPSGSSRGSLSCLKRDRIAVSLADQLKERDLSLADQPKQRDLSLADQPKQRDLSLADQPKQRDLNLAERLRQLTQLTQRELYVPQPQVAFSESTIPESTLGTETQVVTAQSIAPTLGSVEDLKQQYSQLILSSDHKKILDLFLERGFNTWVLASELCPSERGLGLARRINTINSGFTAAKLPYRIELPSYQEEATERCYRIVPTNPLNTSKP